MLLLVVHDLGVDHIAAAPARLTDLRLQNPADLHQAWTFGTWAPVAPAFL